MGGDFSNKTLPLAQEISKRTGILSIIIQSLTTAILQVEEQKRAHLNVHALYIV